MNIEGDEDFVKLDPGYFEVTKGLKIAGTGLLLFVLINVMIIVWMKCSYKKYYDDVRAKGVDELSVDTDDANMANDVANANESEIAPINVE